MQARTGNESDEATTPTPLAPVQEGRGNFVVLRKRQAIMMDFFFNFHAHPTGFKEVGQEATIC